MTTHTCPRCRGTGLIERPEERRSKPQRPPRNTGPDQRTRNIVRVRAKGLCENCGQQRGTEIHHRRTRGMGGSSDPATNSPANLMLLCGDCHRWATVNPKEALDVGVNVPQGFDPSEVEVVIAGELTYLTPDGHYQRRP